MFEMVEKKCEVDWCQRPAEYGVFLYDFYPVEGEVFFEQDISCPYICREHAIENEKKAQGERKFRGVVYYPYTNRYKAQGITIYRPLKNDD